MTASLRPARVGDAPEITACVNAAYRHYIERLGKKPGPMLEDYAKSIRQHQMHVAEQVDGIVGALVLMITAEGFLLHMIAVHPSAQGTGVGRMLLEFAEAEALRQGYRSIYLMTNEKMTENQVLYAKIGYVLFDRREVDGYFRVLMRKELR